MSVREPQAISAPDLEAVRRLGGWIYEMEFLKYLVPWAGTYAILFPIQLLVLNRMGIKWSERGSPRCTELQADGWRHS